MSRLAYRSAIPHNSHSLERKKPSDPAHVAQEVAFVGRRTSGRQAEGDGQDGGGSGQAGGGRRWAGGRLQELGGVDWRAGRQLTIAGRGKTFAWYV